MSDNPLSGKVSLDTTDYKAGVKELDRQMRIIESGFRATAAGMGDWDQSAQGLELRIDALNGKIELQQNKIGALGNEYKKIVEEKGATSQAAQYLEIKLNQATESLNKMKGELASSQVSLSEMAGGSQQTAQQIDNLNRQMQIVETGFRSATAGMENWSNTSQGLEKRIAALNSQVDLQKQKVATLQSEYQKVAEAKGADSQAAQELQIKLNQESEALGKLQAELASSEKSLSEMGSQSQSTEDKVDGLTRQIEIIESGFRAAAAGMEDWDKSSEGLKTRISALTGQIDLQKQKVSALESEYRKVAQEKGSTSRAAQELEIKLNKETETLNKMQGELDSSEKSLSEMGKESQNAGDKTDDLKKAEDKATGATEKLARAMSGLKKGIASAAAGIGNMITKVAKLAAGLAVGLVGAASAATVGLVALAATTIGPASDFNETVSKTQVVFGEAAEEVLAFGEGSATALGMSSNAALSAAGTYGNLFRSMGIAEQTSADMSTSLVQLAGDLASFNNMDPTVVLQKLRSGLTGETEPLKDLAININQAALEAKAMELGLIGVDEEMTASAKAQAAYALMMEQTTLAQGDFARTSQENANQQRIFEAQLENTRKKIGNGFLPLVTLGINLLNRFLASPQVQEGLERLVAGIQEMTNYLTTAFAGEDPFEAVRKGLDTLGERFPIIEKIVGGVESLVAKLGELKAGFEEGGISGLFEALLPEEGIGGMLEGLAETVGELLSNLLMSAATKPAMMLDIGLKMINGLAGALSVAIPNLLPVVIQLLNSFVQFITQSVPLLLPAAIQMVKSLLEFIVKNISLLIKAGIEIITTLVEGILPMLPLLVEAALQIIITLAEGIAEALPELIPAVLEIIPQIVLTLLDNLPQIIEAALKLIIALATGLMDAIPVLIPYIPKIVQAVFDALIESLPLIGEAAVELILTLAEGIMGALPEIGTVAVETVETYINGLLDLYGKIIEVGANIVGGVWEGISSQAAWFGEQVNSFFSNIVGGVKDSLGIHSESTVFAGIGKNMALGMGGGFDRQFKEIEGKMRSAVQGLSGSVSLSVNGAEGSSASRSTVNHLGGIHIHIAGNADKDTVSRAAEDGVLRALKAAGAA